MEPFGFDKLPEIVRQLFEKVEHIELMLQDLQPAADDDDQLLNVIEAADFLKTTPAALYSKVSRKEIPVNKPGKRLYFNKKDLKDWIRLGQKKTMDEINKEARKYCK